MNPSIRPFEAAQPAVPNTTALTIREAVSVYIVHDAKRTGRCQRSAKERERLLLEFCDSYGDRLVSQCCAADLQFWIDAHSEWKSDWTILRVLRTIQRPFNWLASLDVIPRSPFRALSHPTGERGRAMEPEEFQKLLRGTDSCFRRVLVALRWSGMRPCELRALEWEHIDLARSCIILRLHKTARTRKDRKPRLITLHPVVVKLLIWIRRHHPIGKFVFLNSRGRPWTRSAIDLRMWKLRKKVGLDPTCKLYSARHAFATQAAMNGVDIVTLAELLGHTTTGMAAYYVHLHGQTDHLRAAVIKAMK